MRAVCWTGVNKLSVETVPDPKILNPHDAIFKVKMSTACGSDLHLIDGYIPTMEAGDIIGHEFMGEVVETGPEVQKLKKGDRAVVISILGCGKCYFCSHQMWSLCDNTNPNARMAEKLWGHSIAGVFGYSHLTGGYAGAHAEYVRVPFADNGSFPVPEGVRDEQVIFASDAFPTGYMAAEMCNIQPGQVIAVWGCGGVGQMAIKSAFLMGAERVIAIDRLPERLEMARRHGKAETLNYEHTDVYDALQEMTGGRGPDACIDAVGMEAHSFGADYWYDRTKQALRVETDRPQVLRQMVRCCRKGGTLSVIGVYGGFIDKFPMGAFMNKALTMRSGQMFGQKYAPKLLDYIAKGEVDPSFMITHRLPLDEIPRGYQMFKEKQDGCIRPVFVM